MLPCATVFKAVKITFVRFNYEAIYATRIGNKSNIILVLS